MREDEIIEFSLDLLEEDIVKDEVLIFDDFTEKIWEFIQTSNIEEYRKFLSGNDIVEDCLLIEALYAYLVKDKKAKKMMFEVIKKNIDDKAAIQSYFELLIFTADKLKGFYSDEKTLNFLSTYIIQSTIYFNSSSLRYYFDIYKPICESGFYLLRQDLKEQEKKAIYLILFNFLHNMDYHELTKESYKLYLKYYLKVLWNLKGVFPNLAKKMFSPLFNGVVYKSMELDSEEEKIAKLKSFGLDEEIAKEILELTDFKFEDDIPF